jgi:hypothetical protein
VVACPLNSQHTYSDTKTIPCFPIDTTRNGKASAGTKLAGPRQEGIEPLFAGAEVEMGGSTVKFTRSIEACYSYIDVTDRLEVGALTSGRKWYSYEWTTCNDL